MHIFVLIGCRGLKLCCIGQNAIALIFLKLMDLQQSIALVDRCLVTLCSDLPESMGLYDTPRDRLSFSAIREMPLLRNLRERSKKHTIILDWMQTYVPKEDQALSSDIRLEEVEKSIEEGKNGSEDVMEGKVNGVVHEESKKSQKRVVRGKAEFGEQRDNDKWPLKTINIMDSDDEFQNGENEFKMSTHSSSDESPNRDGDRKAQKRKLSYMNSTNKLSSLPSLDDILSPESEDDQAKDNQDEFYIDDPDVYEVERILDRRLSHNCVKYLIQWVGYEEPTWEPAENISKDLIREFDKNNINRDEYVVDKILDRKAELNEKTGLQTYFYLVKWVGYQDDTWEPADNLPHNLRRKFDQKCAGRKRGRLE
uniref:Chromodomain protein putative n=1 Tax=Albugo laibachii Nc14 TaxID=890382 RepID=F0VYQ4_9STRA|nr:chromodomain protein putative [Albugo laibachii Nc14]|eukprot:CCA13918.1 chromodomain protein putative [Albugo laibachii Nc14]